MNRNWGGKKKSGFSFQRACGAVFEIEYDDRMLALPYKVTALLEKFMPCQQQQRRPSHQQTTANFFFLRNTPEIRDFLMAWPWAKRAFPARGNRLLIDYNDNEADWLIEFTIDKCLIDGSLFLECDLSVFFLFFRVILQVVGRCTDGSDEPTWRGPRRGRLPLQYWEPGWVSADSVWLDRLKFIAIVISGSWFIVSDKRFFYTGNNNASGQQIDQKSGQWFGATVRSAGPNGAVVVSFCLLFWCVAMFLDWLCCWCFDYAGLRSSLPLVLKQLQSQRASGDLLRGQRLVQRVLGVLPMQD